MLAPPLGIFEVFWAISGIALLHNCQIFEESLLGISRSRSCCLGKLRYLISRNFFHHVGSPVMSLQTILPPNAKLRNLGDLIPIPLRSWGWITYFQLIKLIFFLSFSPPAIGIGEGRFPFCCGRRPELEKEKNDMGERRYTWPKKSEATSWVDPNRSPLLHFSFHFVDFCVPDFYSQRSSTYRHAQVR